MFGTSASHPYQLRGKLAPMVSLKSWTVTLTEGKTTVAKIGHTDGQPGFLRGTFGKLRLVSG